jgi:N-acetylglutamate synthase
MNPALSDSIRHLEELSLNAWPAARQALFDGWVLRFSDGYTRRANSVNPLYPGHFDLEEKIDQCERMYRSTGLPTVFKLTDASEPRELDSILGSRGYALEASTSVQTLALSEFTIEGQLFSRPDLLCFDSVNETWLDALAGFSPSAASRRGLLYRMLSSIAPPARFAMALHDGRPVSLGMAVADQGHVGLFDLVTDPHHRRRGHARRLLVSLLSWARHTHHTGRAYLQVVLDNLPAIALYAEAGFREHHRYAYRVKSL